MRSATCSDTSIGASTCSSGQALRLSTLSPDACQSQRVVPFGGSKTYWTRLLSGLCFTRSKAKCALLTVKRSCFSSARLKKQELVRWKALFQPLCSSPIIDTNKEEKPNHVHHMPIPGRRFKTKMVFFGKMPPY